jgi:type I restriction enzyme S subunit
MERHNAEAQRHRDAEAEILSAPSRLGDSAFKETEIGLLPAEWDVVPFTSSIQKKRIRAGKIKKRDYKPAGDFPIIDQGQEFIGGYWNDPGALYKGDLPVVIFGDHTRIFKFVDFPFIRGADGVKVLIPNRKRFDPNFFYFACLSLEISSRGYSRHYKYLKEKYLPRPTLPEQRRIAGALRTIQEAIAAQEDVIAAARELKRSLMERVFTYGPGAEPAPTKETETGEIPEHWEMLQLGDVCSFTTGKLNANQAVPKGRYPFFTCAQETYRIDLYSFDQEAILLSGNNARGVYSVKHYKGKFDAYQRTYVITIEQPDKVSYEYLLYELTRKLNLLRRNSIGATTKYLTATMIRNLVLSVPSPGEQRAIAELVGAADAKIAAEEQRKAALDDLFHSALKQLMTGQIRLNAETQRNGAAEENHKTAATLR